MARGSYAATGRPPDSNNRTSTQQSSRDEQITHQLDGGGQSEKQSEEEIDELASGSEGSEGIEDAHRMLSIGNAAILKLVEEGVEEETNKLVDGLISQLSQKEFAILTKRAARKLDRYIDRHISEDPTRSSLRTCAEFLENWSEKHNIPFLPISRNSAYLFAYEHFSNSTADWDADSRVAILYTLSRIRKTGNRVFKTLCDKEEIYRDRFIRSLVGTPEARALMELNEPLDTESRKIALAQKSTSVHEVEDEDHDSLGSEDEVARQLTSSQPQSQRRNTSSSHQDSSIRDARSESSKRKRSSSPLHTDHSPRTGTAKRPNLNDKPDPISSVTATNATSITDAALAAALGKRQSAKKRPFPFTRAILQSPEDQLDIGISGASRAQETLRSSSPSLPVRPMVQGLSEDGKEIGALSVSANGPPVSMNAASDKTGHLSSGVSVTSTANISQPPKGDASSINLLADRVLPIKPRPRPPLYPPQRAASAQASTSQAQKSSRPSLPSRFWSTAPEDTNCTNADVSASFHKPLERVPVDNATLQQDTSIKLTAVKGQTALAKQSSDMPIDVSAVTAAQIGPSMVGKPLSQATVASSGASFSVGPSLYPHTVPSSANMRNAIQSAITQHGPPNSRPQGSSQTVLGSESSAALLPSVGATALSSQQTPALSYDEWDTALHDLEMAIQYVIHRRRPFDRLLQTEEALYKGQQRALKVASRQFALNRNNRRAQRYMILQSRAQGTAKDYTPVPATAKEAPIQTVTTQTSNTNPLPDIRDGDKFRTAQPPTESRAIRERSLSVDFIPNPSPASFLRPMTAVPSSQPQTNPPNTAPQSLQSLHTHPPASLVPVSTGYNFTHIFPDFLRDIRRPTLVTGKLPVYLGAQHGRGQTAHASDGQSIPLSNPAINPPTQGRHSINTVLDEIASSLFGDTQTASAGIKADSDNSQNYERSLVVDHSALSNQETHFTGRTTFSGAVAGRDNQAKSGDLSPHHPFWQSLRSTSNMPAGFQTDASQSHSASRSSSIVAANPAASQPVRPMGSNSGDIARVPTESQSGSSSIVTVPIFHNNTQNNQSRQSASASTGFPLNRYGANVAQSLNRHKGHYSTGDLPRVGVGAASRGLPTNSTPVASPQAAALLSQAPHSTSVGSAMQPAQQYRMPRPVQESVNRVTAPTWQSQGPVGVPSTRGPPQVSQGTFKQPVPVVTHAQRPNLSHSFPVQNHQHVQQATTPVVQPSQGSHPTQSFGALRARGSIDISGTAPDRQYVNPASSNVHQNGHISPVGVRLENSGANGTGMSTSAQVIPTSHLRLPGQSLAPSTSASPPNANAARLNPHQRPDSSTSASNSTGMPVPNTAQHPHQQQQRHQPHQQQQQPPHSQQQQQQQLLHPQNPPMSRTQDTSQYAMSNALNRSTGFTAPAPGHSNGNASQRVPSDQTAAPPPPAVAQGMALPDLQRIAEFQNMLEEHARAAGLYYDMEGIVAHGNRLLAGGVSQLDVEIFFRRAVYHYQQKHKTGQGK